MTKRKIIYILLATVGLYVLYWFYSHSFVEILVENSTSNQAISYSLKNQASSKTSETKASSTKIRKLVAKADYEVLVKQNNVTHFSIVTTKGFLSTTKITAKLIPEKSRKFVGDGPEQCVKYINNVLLSYVCGGFYGDINVHVPASKNEPTYIDTIRDPGATGRIEGFINYRGRNLVLIYGSVDEDAPAQHQLYDIGNDFRLSNRIVLSGLDQRKNYSARDQGDGFIVYDSDNSQIYFFTSPEARPQQIKIGRPAEEGLEAASLDFNSNSYLVLYLSRATEQERKWSEAVINTGGQSSHYNFKKSYTSALFCGSDKICLLTDGLLDIYQVNGKEAKLLYSVTGATSIANSANGLLVARKDEVINLNADTAAGYIEYDLGDYEFSSLSTDNSEYILRLIDNKKRTIALLVDQVAVNTDSVDKKISELQKNPSIDFVSTYDKFIYVAADLGELVYDSAKRSYSYDPERKKAAADEINRAIDRLGIDRKVYSISSNAF